jgi:hypothetical protein
MRLWIVMRLGGLSQAGGADERQKCGVRLRAAWQLQVARSQSRRYGRTNRKRLIVGNLDQIAPHLVASYHGFGKVQQA